MPTLDDTDRLLDLLVEAGDEPVTLDELAIVGVPEPARLLAALEREGHPLSRVADTRADRPVACVRLRGGDEATAAAAPRAPEPSVGAPRAAAARPTDRPLLVALVALLLVLVVRGARAR